MAFTVKKAERKQVYAKIALMASSGGGKTYSSLRLATGMAEEIEKMTGKKGRIVMINTESDRGYYYANEFDYDIVDFSAPYTPERFIEAINFAISEGYDICIIDSASHEWEGKGGCLELHAKAGGKYQDWAKITPRHNKFIDTIASSKIHIISTMRGKDQYDMSKDDNGRMTVQKLGVGAKQRDGFEYEFTCTFNIDQKTSMADVQKDNTHIFDEEGSMILTEEHGRKIIQWANSGNAKSMPKTKVESVDKLEKEKNESRQEKSEEELFYDVNEVENDNEQEYPEDLLGETTQLYKNCTDKALKKEVLVKVKEYGKFTDVPLEELKSIYIKLK